MAAKIDSSKCTGCGACVEVWPVDAIKLAVFTSTYKIFLA